MISERTLAVQYIDDLATSRIVPSYIGF